MDQRLEGPGSRAYRASQIGSADPRISNSNALPPGVKMRRIGWAIALAAAWLTPAAAKAPVSAPAPAKPSAAAPVATPPDGTAQNPDKPDAGQPNAPVGTTGHM